MKQNLNTWNKRWIVVYDPFVNIFPIISGPLIFQDYVCYSYIQDGIVMSWRSVHSIYARIQLLLFQKFTPQIGEGCNICA